jgi:uncharacterized protein
MEIDNLNQILAYWSFWDKHVPNMAERNVLFPKELSPERALVIQGVRRCGKSTLLLQVLKHYKLNKEHCVFINFEDPKLSQELSTNILDKIVEVFSKNKAGKKLYYFFDEVQHVPDWEKWIHTKLERPSKNHFIITGSNAALLSGELSSALTGRYVKIELYPLSFHESQKLKKKTNFASYLKKGGFPAPFLTKDGDNLLKQYFDDIIEKDIRNRIAARSSQSIRQVIQMVYESSGTELSLRRIAGATGLSVDTVSSYLEAAELAYLVLSCEFFSYSKKKRATKNIKYYPVDSGLRRTVITQVGEDLGKMLEIAVFIELKKRFPYVYYWKDRGEVDFVVETKTGLLPIQVSWDQAKERHMMALENFYEHYPQAREALFVDRKSFGLLGDLEL